MPPTLIVVSGPSGVGKTTIIHAMCERFPNFKEAVACTTRSPRAEEVEGKDYYFLDNETFSLFMASDMFFISEIYDGHRYGILKSELIKNEGYVFLNIGIPSLKLIPPAVRDGAITIYMMPSNISDLKRWMHGRGEERLRVAKSEIPEAIKNFEYLVINRDGELEASIAQVLAILQGDPPAHARIESNICFLKEFYEEED